jgi:Na+/H+ antiporter NhaD/arsenite permease-like protein
VLTAAVILTVTYIGIAFAWLPRVNIDRPAAAFIGGLLMVLFGIISFGEAVTAINFHILGLLLGMMMLIAGLQAVGFFNLVVVKALSIADTPRRLLLLVVTATAVASAFFVNDAVVLLFTPIIVQTCRQRQVNPVPYLIAEAMASNIGSTATIVGNPQNMLIGITAGISFTRFFLYLLPVAAVATIVLIFLAYGFYRRDFSHKFIADSMTAPPYDVAAIKRLTPVLVMVLLSFFLSSYIRLEISLIALGGAALILVVGRVKPAVIIRSVDWVLLLFFAGLFVVIEGAHHAGVLDVFTREIVVTPDFVGITSISVVSTIVSQVVSNVPLTMLVIPIIKNVPGDTLWIALAAGSTLGGNLTIIGAVANIIVVEIAARDGVTIGFVEFLKIGVAVTVVTVGAAILILGAEYWLGWLR